MKETDILYEAAPFYVAPHGADVEIRMHASSGTYAVAVGRRADLESAKRTIARLLRHLPKVRAMYTCP